jgi:hypothetical protein
MDPESDALHERARAFVRAFEAGAAMPEPFDALACDLARFQARRNEGYARLCRARGVDPEELARADDVPAVPTDAFKAARVATFPEDRARALFRTSGTTLGARGTHAMRDTGSYDAAALAFGRWALRRGLPERAPILVLGPSPREAPESSLAHMNALFAAHWGDGAFLVEREIFDLAGFDERVATALVAGTPVLVLATSFALVLLLDALGEELFRLPRGSRVMHTGGYKGKSREVPREILRRDVARAFCVDERAIVAEYGMTELSSQFYEATVARDDASAWVFVEPPWARVVPVDPVSLAPVPEGEIGIARITDLMNVDSAAFVLAADCVRRVPGGFELLGRAPGAPPRGCSIALDEMLA